jgi:hypothetical protein
MQPVGRLLRRMSPYLAPLRHAESIEERLMLGAHRKSFALSEYFAF